jgi:hypothetical protein
MRSLTMRFVDKRGCGLGEPLCNVLWFHETLCDTVHQALQESELIGSG